MAKFVVPFARAPHNHDPAEFSDLSAVEDFGPSMTVQSQKDEADINVIVERFGIGYEMPQNVRAPSYGDFTGMTDYQSARHALMQADVSFAALPASVRAQFDNDAGLFVNFCLDEKNLGQLREWGLAIPLEVSNGNVSGGGVGSQSAAKGEAPAAGPGSNASAAGGSSEARV